MLLVKNMLGSKLHCQKGFNSIIFSCKIEVYRVCEGGRRGRERRQRPRVGGRKARASATLRALLQVEGSGPWFIGKEFQFQTFWQVFGKDQIGLKGVEFTSRPFVLMLSGPRASEHESVVRYRERKEGGGTGGREGRRDGGTEGGREGGIEGYRQREREV